jgi:amino acid transporter
MTRIFVTLAAVNAAALLLTFGVGVAFMYEREAGALAPAPAQPLGWSWFTAHIVLALFTAVLTLLVHCLIFTYFLGTGRWVKEVARSYGLPDQHLPRQTREFKRRAFPPALFAMLVTIAAAASGAGAQAPGETAWHWAHPILAVITLVINGWAYVVEYQTVSANVVVVNQVKEQADRMRAEQLAFAAPEAGGREA